ncbi:sugar MFS transporter [Cellulomonas sp. SLBN-39]|uniref:MFS transporter n=1 Tax=Cellulomonas sp. SLBN-39 TaxID=2768446 RepID=UPI00114D6D3A|nr:MFS transporter [Cellulomonas sp. SLBN-39]TQL03954.1 fucose permease [Cellulomonas sp. SLBN-39]
MTAPDPAPARLVRDRTTLTLYGPFVVWGWLLYSFNPSVPLLADELGITSAQAGLHGTAMAAGGLTAAVLTPRTVRALGRRATIVVSALVVALGIGALVTGPALPWTLAGMLLTSVGGNVLISAAQVGLALQHGRAASAAVTEANGVGAAVGLLGPLAVGAAVTAGIGWRAGVVVTAVLAVVSALLVARLPTGPALTGRPARRIPQAVVAGAASAVAPAVADPTPTDAPVAATVAVAPAGRVRRATPWLLLALLAALALENATTYWATGLVVERTGADPGIGAATTAGLVAGMAAMRFVVGPLSLRVPPARLLAGSFILAVVGWAVLWTATTPGVALAGLVVAGLGYGAQYPLAVVLLLAASPGRSDRAQAQATLTGALAIGVAPFVLGALADAVGTHTAFLVVPALAALGLVGAVVGGSAVRATARRLEGSDPWPDPTSDPSPGPTTPASPTTSA